VQKTESRVKVRRSWQKSAAALVAVAWAAIGYGLFFSAPDRQAWDDLEAGGRFAVNVTVYLPYLALTLLLLVVVLLGLLNSSDLVWLPATTAVGIASFAWWVASHGLLLEAQPQLQALLGWCLAADLGAGAALAGAWVTAGD
jgi:hypothetical protein